VHSSVGTDERGWMMPQRTACLLLLGRAPVGMTMLEMPGDGDGDEGLAVAAPAGRPWRGRRATTDRARYLPSVEVRGSRASGECAAGDVH
jgi:hypothetical protein